MKIAKENIIVLQAKLVVAPRSQKDCSPAAANDDDPMSTLLVISSNGKRERENLQFCAFDQRLSTVYIMGVPVVVRES